MWSLVMYSNYFEWNHVGKDNGIINLSWMAASTNEVGFHVSPTFPSPASASTTR